MTSMAAAQLENAIAVLTGQAPAGFNLAEMADVPKLPQIPFIWFALKTAFFIMIFILLRASIPRPRYDQVMDFSWKFCLPLTLINLLVTAAIVLMNTPAVAVQ